jgi:hypothetical protein
MEEIGVETKSFLQITEGIQPKRTIHFKTITYEILKYQGRKRLRLNKERWS